MTRFVQTIGDISMAGALFRETDLSRVTMRGVLLFDADIDGAINGLRINGVEVTPLIEAELDRRHPERLKLRPTTPEGMREAVDVIEELWAGAIERAQRIDAVDRSVDDEWSLAESLRHAIFVVDSWFGQATMLWPRPFHPLGLPAGFITDGAEFGIDTGATPTFDEVLAARADRIAGLRAYLADVTQDELDRVRGPNPVRAFPPPAERTAVECLNVIFSDEWAHIQFAHRDLALIEESDTQPGT
jgi:DinB superfamily